MKKKVLFLLIGCAFLLQLGIYFSSVNSQSNPVAVPPINRSIEETQAVNEADNESDDTDTMETVLAERTEESTTEERIFQVNSQADYYALNSDYVGWLTIDDTRVDYPVVRGQDNDYYLSHNFYKEEDQLGPFLWIIEM